MEEKRENYVLYVWYGTLYLYGKYHQLPLPGSRYFNINTNKKNKKQKTMMDPPPPRRRSPRNHGQQQLKNDDSSHRVTVSSSSKKPSNSNNTDSKTKLKIKINRYHGVAKWTWGVSGFNRGDGDDDEDEVCIVCQSAFEGCAPGVKYPVSRSFHLLRLV